MTARTPQSQSKRHRVSQVVPVGADGDGYPVSCADADVSNRPGKAGVGVRARPVANPTATPMTRSRVTALTTPDTATATKHHSAIVEYRPTTTGRCRP